MEQHNIIWRSIEIEITYTPEKFGMVDHVELRTKGKTKLPVTETGYRSHFMDKGAVATHGGAVAFVTACASAVRLAKPWFSNIALA